MKTLVTGREFYQILSKHIELPQIIDNIEITLTVEEFSEIVVNGEELDIEREKAFTIFKEMTEIYDIPTYTETLKLSFTADSTVRLLFKSFLTLKE